MNTKRTNRFLAILLTLVMVIGMFPMTAFAGGEAAGTHSSHCLLYTSLGEDVQLTVAPANEAGPCYII